MIMLSQCVHAMLVHNNLKMCCQQLKETFSLMTEACDNEDRFPKVPTQIVLRVHYTRQNVCLNYKLFLTAWQVHWLL